MNKRRRTSSVSRLEEDFDDAASDHSPAVGARKRKKAEPDVVCVCHLEYSFQLKQLFL